MNDRPVMLISMPWSRIDRPSIQLGILRSVLSRAGVRTEVRSYNLAFMDHLVAATAGLPAHDRISFKDYSEVDDEFWYVGLGDWIFAVAPFRAPGEQDEKYIEYFGATANAHPAMAKASLMRDLVPSFLERCVDDVLAARPAIVGFTSTFTQNVPSLVLAKLIKARDPSVHIILGGFNCDGSMGDALHRSFSWVDTVVRGEAELVLPELIFDLFHGDRIRPQPGLCYREDGRRVVVGQESGKEVPMDHVPMPNYDEYFERLEKSRARAEILPHLAIPFESARGCWWGAKKHCTFCGFNGSSMAFRSKSPDLVIDELLTLARKHGHLAFNAVDNIIDMRYFREFLPKLRDAGYDFKIFYETKANLKKEHLRAMQEAGATYIQPGIESLSTAILKLMDKGMTGLQNIRLLKWCAEVGIQPAWNLIYGFPGEPREEYDRMMETMKSLTHLTPPENVPVLAVERFSPYHARPQKYGLTIKGPKPFYGLIYPCDEEALTDLAYAFEYTHDDHRNPEVYAADLKESVKAWQRDFHDGSNLRYRRGPGFLLIEDRRPGLGGYDYSLPEKEAKIYLGCDAGATPLAAWKAFQADGELDIDLEDVEDFLNEMTELKLMYREDATYLSLALPANPQKSIVKAGDQASHAELAANPAFVQTSHAGMAEKLV